MLGLNSTWSTHRDTISATSSSTYHEEARETSQNPNRQVQLYTPSTCTNTNLLLLFAHSRERAQRNRRQAAGIVVRVFRAGFVPPSQLGGENERRHRSQNRRQVPTLYSNQWQLGLVWFCFGFGQ